MALGTPVAAAAAYSASGGTSVSPTYPSGILATDAVVLFVGQKPSTANGGSVTTPSGWTLQEELLAAGGYGTTLGADTGNTNLRVYTWNSPVANQTGSLSVTLSGNGVAWAFIVRIPSGGNSLAFNSADGQRTTSPTAGTPFTVALADAPGGTQFKSGDIALWAMCIPTDVTTPNQFSAQSVTATGATFGTAVELNEPDSSTGNDIGGYSAYATVTAGSATTAPSVTVTASGTVTNVRGPVVMLRIRDLSQELTPSLYDNTNTFYSASISQTTPAQDLSPNRYDNTNTFYTPDITQTGGVQNLDPALYANTNVFYSATVTSTRALVPALYTNTNTFYSATVSASKTLTPARYDNTNVFYTPVVTATGADHTLLPSLYQNASTFYSATVGRGSISLLAPFYTNEQTFYSPTVEQMAYHINPPRVDNTSTFYSATIGQFENIAPALYVNPNTFYAASASATATIRPQRPDNSNSFYSPSISIGPTVLSFQDYSQSGYVDTGYTTLGVLNVSTVYSPSSRNVNYIAPPLVADGDTFYSATLVKVAYALAPTRVENQNTFYATTASIEQFVSPPLTANQNTFYAAHVAIDQFITAPLVTNTNTIYSVSVNSSYPLTPTQLTSTNAFYTSSVTVGPAFVLPALSVNQNKFYKQSIIWWDNQPDVAESWTAEAEVPATWDDIPITIETWTPISDTAEIWQQAA